MNGRSASSVFANPVLVGAVTVLVVIVAVFLSYNANNGLPFVPDHVAQGPLRQRPEPRQGQRDPLGRLPHRRRRGHEAGQALGGPDRGRAQAQARQDDREDPRGLALAHPPALRARPQVPRADRGRPPRRRSPTATPSRSSRPRSTSTSTRSSRCSTRRPARPAARTSRASATPSPAAAPPSGARSRRRRGCSATSSPWRATSPTRTRSCPTFFKELGDAARIVAPISKTNSRLFTTMADTWEAFARDEEALRQFIAKQPADDGRRDLVLPGAAPVPGRADRASRRTSRARRRSCAARCPTSTRRSRPARASSAACPSSTRSSRARSPRSRT